MLALRMTSLFSWSVFIGYVGIILSLLSLMGHAAESPVANPQGGAKGPMGPVPPQPAEANNAEKPQPDYAATGGKSYGKGASSLRRRHKSYGSKKGYGGGGGYDGDYSGETNAYGYGYSLVDDFICDLDASILVVTNSEKRYKKPSKSYGGNKGYGKESGESYKKSSDEGYGSHDHSYEASGSNEEYGSGGSGYRRRPKRMAYGGGYSDEESQGYGGSYSKKKAYYSVAKAHRLRCSAIAIGSDEDCTSCCQLAARKDRSVARKSIIGFIIDYDEIQESEDGYGDSEQKRYKRGTEAYGTSTTNYGGAQPPAYGPSNDYKASESSGYKKADSYGSDDSYGKKKSSGYYAPEKPYVSYPKCVCCSPKSRVSYGGGKGYGGKGKNYGYGNSESEESGEYGSGYDNEGYEDAGYGSGSEEKSGGSYKHKSKKHHHHHHKKGGYKNSKSEEEY